MKFSVKVGGLIVLVSFYIKNKYYILEGNIGQIKDLTLSGGLEAKPKLFSLDF